MKISAFFPLYNEEANVEALVKQAQAILSAQADDHEIILVNDGSRDKTRAVAEKLIEGNPKIRLINHEKNLGYGAALRSGFAASKYDLIFQADGDNQFDLSEIGKLLPFINDYDFVIGYRIKRRDPFFRILEAGFYRLLLALMFGIQLRDANCAFKLFKKRIMDQIKIETSGALINGEIFIKARTLGYSKIKEIGVNHYPRKAGKQTGAKPGVLFDALLTISSFWFKNLKGRI